MFELLTKQAVQTAELYGGADNMSSPSMMVPWTVNAAPSKLFTSHREDGLGSVYAATLDVSGSVRM